MIKKVPMSGQIEKEPWSIWNSFVGILVIEYYSRLSETKRISFNIYIS